MTLNPVEFQLLTPESAAAQQNEQPAIVASNTPSNRWKMIFILFGIVLVGLGVAALLTGFFAPADIALHGMMNSNLLTNYALVGSGGVMGSLLLGAIANLVKQNFHNKPTGSVTPVSSSYSKIAGDLGSEITTSHSTTLMNADESHVSKASCLLYKSPLSQRGELPPHPFENEEAGKPSLR